MSIWDCEKNQLTPISMKVIKKIKKLKNRKKKIKNKTSDYGCPTIADWQDCEFYGKFTFTFRKKYYLSGK